MLLFLHKGKITFKKIINNNIKILKIFSAIFIMAASLSLMLMSACSNNSGTADDKSDDSYTTVYSKSKYLRVGVDTTFPPFAFMMEDKISGFDIDFITEIAKRMGKELKLTHISYNDIYDKINDPEIDLIISAITQKSEKEKTVDYSEPYYVLEYTLITLTTGSYNLKEDMINKKIGLLKNEEEDLSDEFLAFYSNRSYEDVTSLINSLKAGEIDGILISVPIGAKLLKDDPNTFKFINKVESNEKYCIMLKKDSDIKDTVNRLIDLIKKDGTYEKIYDNWLKF